MNPAQARNTYLPAAQAALARFGLPANSIEFVSRAENVTFRVEAPGGGESYALRLHRPGYNSRAALDSERCWTGALAAAGIRVQRSLRTPAGDNFCRVAIEATGEQCYAGLTTWLPGQTLGQVLAARGDPAARRQAYRHIGTLAAQLHNQAGRWEAPPDFVRPRLDIDGLLGEAPRWGRFWDHAALSSAERNTLLRLRAMLRDKLEAYGLQPETFSVIHADLHPHNLIVSGNQLSLIDFDDAAWGWHLYDLASALVEHWTGDDFAEVRAALLAGYRQQRALSDADERMLEDFLALRSLALIGWLHQRPDYCDQNYLSGLLDALAEYQERER